jgi:hypothetical protein
MVNMTLAIPDELHKKMKEMSEIRWSEIARRAIEEKIKEKLSQEDKEAINWAVRLQKSSRSGRLDDLKKKGLI